MRRLTKEETERLIGQGCYAADWEKIEIEEEMDIAGIRNVHFGGSVRIGVGTTIYNAYIENCEIGRENVIRNIHQELSGYKTEENVEIVDCGSIRSEKDATFGIGHEVAPVNEAGGREVRLSEHLTSNIAYIVAMHRYKKETIEGYNRIVEREAEEIRGNAVIGANTKIKGVKKICDVRVGRYATIENASALINGTILSEKIEPTYIGTDVYCKDFVVAEGAKVDTGAEMHSCYVGQCSIVGAKFFGENCLVFANCQLLNGEAVAAFCGPFTVSHHKTSLLIAGYYSYFNAGSATNASNHHYRLGPSHQAVYDRGTKTGSGSYVLEPAHIGAYTMVVGHHKGNPDSSVLPFSYLINKGEESYILPAQNMKTIGLFRDEQKWKTRDKREKSIVRDITTVDVFNPMTISAVLEAVRFADEQMEKTDGDTIVYKGTRIQKGLMRRARKSYQDIAEAYIAEHADTSITANAPKRWCDCGGMIISKERLDAIEEKMGRGEYESVADIAKDFETYQKEYEKEVGAWCSTLLTAPIEEMRAKAAETYRGMMNSIIADAEKELTARLATGYGADAGEEEAGMEYGEIHPSDNKAIGQCREYYEGKIGRLINQQ